MAYDLWHRKQISQSFARGDGSASLDLKALVMAGAVLALPHVSRAIDLATERRRLRDPYVKATLEMPAMPMEEMMVYDHKDGS